MEVAQMKAYVPKSLKRRAFSVFATLDMTFSRWTREQLEKWLVDVGSQGSISGMDVGAEASHAPAEAVR